MDVHNLEIDSPYDIIQIEDIKIECSPNNHGTLYLKCLIDDSIEYETIVNAQADDEIVVYEKGSNDIQFKGIINEIETSCFGRLFYLEIYAVTKTILLDLKLESRSFQDINMTYKQLLDKIFKAYTNVTYEIDEVGSTVLGKPLFQYKETDWQFLKRIASELKLELFCDIKENNGIIFNFGWKEGKEYTIENEVEYVASKNLKAFNKAGGYEEGFHDIDYFSYEIKRINRYELNDKIRFKDKEFYVRKYEGFHEKGEIIYKYKLCRKNGIWITKMYNTALSGATLLGKVVEVDGEKVKLDLEIDKDDGDVGEKHWFVFAPPTVNIVYSMPLVGNTASLYFSDEKVEEPKIINCVRLNGETCEKTGDTSKRYFETEHGSQLELLPESITVKGCAEELFVTLSDEVGIIIKSLKNIIFAAVEDIIIKTEQSLLIEAKNNLTMAKKDTKSGFSIEKEFMFFANNVLQAGRSREAFAAIPPPEQPKKKFNWLALGILVLAAAVAVATILTIGIAGIAGLAILGACAGVGFTALGDIISGETSSLKDYVISAFVGAVTGAIFGPIQPTSLASFFGWTALEGGTYSTLDQLLHGGFSFDKLLTDVLFFVALGGIFKGASKIFKSIKGALKGVDIKIPKIKASGVVEGGGKTEFTSLRDLMSPDEVVRYEEHWLNVADKISDEAISNQIGFIKNGGIKRQNGKIYEPSKVSCAVDLNTGNTYIGYSGKKGMNPSKPASGKLESDLQELVDRTKEIAKNTVGNPYADRASFYTYPVDNCAEIFATNNALIGGANIDNIYLNTKHFWNEDYAELCNNCKVTFKGFKTPLNHQNRRN